MALRLFIYMAGSFVSLGFASFFAEHEFEKEPVIVFVIAMTICVIALAPLHLHESQALQSGNPGTLDQERRNLHANGAPPKGEQRQG